MDQHPAPKAPSATTPESAAQEPTDPILAAPVPTQPQPPTGIMQRIVGWLRTGYPEGVPASDYVALLGVLRRKLTDQDIEVIAAQLLEERRATRPEELGAITPEMIRDLIREHALQEPKKKDVARVSARLAAGGWPLGDPETGDDEPLDRGEESRIPDNGRDAS